MGISIHMSSDCIVRNGVIDGNSAENGVGVMFEQDGTITGSVSGGSVSNVDAIRMGNGCFSAYGAQSVTFTSANCRDNICTGQNGRPKASSNSIMYYAGKYTKYTPPWESSNIKLVGSEY